MPVAKGATAKLPAPRVRESFVPSMTITTSGNSVSMMSGKIPTRLEEFVPEIPRFKISSLGVFASSAHNTPRVASGTLLRATKPTARPNTNSPTRFKTEPPQNFLRLASLALDAVALHVEAIPLSFGVGVQARFRK
jgi:hypothetical protein